MNAMTTLLLRPSDPHVRFDLWKRMQGLWDKDAGPIRVGEFFRAAAVTAHGPFAGGRR
jgi:hypothetical protein